MRNRGTHVRISELGQDRSVHVFHHRMHDALRMYDHFHLPWFHTKQHAGLDQLETLVHQGRRVHRYLPPHAPARMCASLVGCDPRHLGPRRPQERAPGGGQQYAAHAGRGRAGRRSCRHALEDRVVLAVDRNECCPSLAGRRDQQRSSDDQRFLIREQDALAGGCGRDRRRQTRRTHDRRHYNLDFRVAHSIHERRSTALDTRGKPACPERSAKFLRGLSVLEDRETGAMCDALREQPAVVRARGERMHVVTVAMARDDVERACADAARAAEYGDAGHTAQPKVVRPSTNAGAAAVRLSIRSSTPPWPGRRLPLSLRPVRRLNMLSTRSPTTEIIATTRQSPSHGRSGCPSSSAPPAAASEAASMPDMRPSQVLPGLTAGASLRRPKRRPPKNAPTSAAAVRTRRKSSSPRPCGSISSRRASPTAAGASTARPASAAATWPPRCDANKSHSSPASHQSIVRTRIVRRFAPSLLAVQSRAIVTATSAT